MLSGREWTTVGQQRQYNIARYVKKKKKKKKIPTTLSRAWNGLEEGMQKYRNCYQKDNAFSRRIFYFYFFIIREF